MCTMTMLENGTLCAVYNISNPWLKVLSYIQINAITHGGGPLGLRATWRLSETP